MSVFAGTCAALLRVVRVRRFDFSAGMMFSITTITMLLCLGVATPRLAHSDQSDKGCIPYYTRVVSRGHLVDRSDGQEKLLWGSAGTAVAGGIAGEKRGFLIGAALPFAIAYGHKQLIDKPRRKSLEDARSLLYDAYRFERDRERMGSASPGSYLIRITRELRELLPELSASIDHASVAALIVENDRNEFFCTHIEKPLGLKEIRLKLIDQLQDTRVIVADLLNQKGDNAFELRDSRASLADQKDLTKLRLQRAPAVENARVPEIGRPIDAVTGN